MRLDKLLTSMSLGSRSEVKILLKKGQVTVNDAVIKDGAIHVNPEMDIIMFQGKRLIYSEYAYYMLNKPAGVISATSDSKQKTVTDLLLAEKRKDLFPVGRLDKDTEGLLILTNDGIMAHNLLAPGKHVPKTYLVILEHEPSQTEITCLETGLDIGEEKKTAPAVFRWKEHGDCPKVLLTITEGRFHQVKRMFEQIDNKVLFLKRLSMGNLKLDESLMPGEYRKLTPTEINQLQGEL